MVRRPFRRRSRFATPRPFRASPTDADYLSGVLCSLPRVDRIGARWLSCGRAPAPGSSRSILPSPILGRVGVHIAAFGACSNFTRVTARRIARPPCVDFVARFPSAPLPVLTARQLSNLTINYSSGSFPHWYSAPLGVGGAGRRGHYGSARRGHGAIGGRQRACPHWPD